MCVGCTRARVYDLFSSVSNSACVWHVSRTHDARSASQTTQRSFRFAPDFVTAQQSYFDCEFVACFVIECRAVCVVFLKLFDASVSLLSTHTRADLRINATRTALYTCTAQNEHIEGRSLAVATTNIHVIG